MKEGSMPRSSVTNNVRKRCACEYWTTCAHPWHLHFQDRKTRYRENLDDLIGFHPRTLSEAQTEARRAIVAKQEHRDPRDVLPSDDPTLADLFRQYAREHGAPRDPWQVKRILAIELRGGDGLRRFGTWRATAVTRDALKQFQRLRPLVAGNRDLALLRTVFNWAVLGDRLPATPFRKGNVPAVKLQREEPRTRRLYPGEEERLLNAGGGLRDLIVAALETGCRTGELLSLQWYQVRFHPRAEIFLPAQKTKAKKDRRVPISVVLRQVLDARRLDPAGDPLPPAAFVFGDALGRRRGDIRNAWKVVVLKANGHTPVWRRNNAKQHGSTLAPISRAELATID